MLNQRVELVRVFVLAWGGHKLIEKAEAQADRKSRTMITIGIQRLFMNSILLWAVRYVKRNDGKLIP
jgi:hypothetical protein